MKTLELTLPTPVLLVWGLPEGAKGFNVIPGNKLYYKASFMGLPNIGAFRDLPEGNWQLIGKLRNLTEDQAKRLVIAWRITALESFHSAIEAEGYFVTNDLPDPELTMRQGNGSVYYGASDQEFQEYADRESKTLPANTLIFKKS